MYIDAQLRLLPTAMPWKRLIAWILDILFTIFIPLLVGLGSIAILIPLRLAGFPNSWVLVLVLLIVSCTMLYVMVWGRWFRVGDVAQTIGMSVMKIAIASDQSEFKSPVLNKWFFWVNYNHKKPRSHWAGDEIEERTDSQLWKGLVPAVLFPAIAGLALIAVQLIGQIPFTFWSLLKGNFEFSIGSNPITYLLDVPILASFIVAELGFLFAFSKDHRTLTDHFLGIKSVDVSGTEFEYPFTGPRKLLTWIRGSDFNPALSSNN